MPVPPKVVRRLVLAPLAVAAELVLLTLSPLLALLAVLASPFFGGWRPLRMVVIALVLAARHLGAVLACLGLWLAAGFGRSAGSPAMRRRHLAVMRWFVAGAYRVVVGLARVEVRFAESDEAHAALATPGRPVLLFARHAGEGDTLLVLYELLCRHERVPCVVMAEKLRLDPLIDVLGERLPNRFVDPRGGDTEEEIAALARELDGTRALVIFPEGRNFSAEARRRGIERLERAGHDEEAAWARDMHHLSAPRPGGALAAVDASPQADVVIMGHAGFPTGPREVWRLLPAPQVIEVRLWHEPAGAIPRDRDERIDWLFAWWRTMDGWVDEQA